MAPVMYPGVYIEEIPNVVRTITGVATSVTAFVGRALCGPVDTPTRVNSFEEYARVFGGLWQGSTMSYAVSHFFQQGGAEALIVRVFRGEGAASPATSGVDPGDAGGEVTDAEIIGDRRDRTGIYALQGALFNLLCIPPLTWESDVANSTWAAAAEYCRERRGVLVVDPPAAWTANATTAIAEAKAGVGALCAAIGTEGAQNAAAYFPRLCMPDPLRNRLAEFAPCGAVAGIIARTDMQRGVWKAPAGTQASLSGVNGFTFTITDAQNGVLSAAGLNCLRTFPGVGNVVWGSRTLASANQLASEWKYVPVRRLALFIEESLRRGMQWVVLEPNEESLWAQIRRDVGAFLHDLFQKGAFQGATPAHAYFVKCDRETVTQADLDAGIVNVVVGFAPIRPAEFVVIRIQQKARQLPPEGGTQ